MGPNATVEGIVVQAAGAVSEGVREYAAQQMANCLSLLRDRPEPAVVRLTWLGASDVARPAVAQANVVRDGRIVRAQLAAPSLAEASERLGQRLIEQLGRSTLTPLPRRWPDERPRPESTVVAGREATVVRRKSYQLERCTPQDAALTMDRCDYDFHLFVDAATGEDSVISRVGPTGYRLTRLAGPRPATVAGTLPVIRLTVDAHPVPSGTTSQIAERVDLAQLGHRFFRDADTGRGAVLYRRYDGNYGLLRGFS
ncbi:MULTISPECIES: sigma 54 modulation/S30EA ribosomal C-terminal domain-containing protein [unclassified Streptomyces]|uniref:sigma 54 modulation/S30EA ribosomal C-terminal domain-containing protein n=1 Tax=unclassified Streptomyces TaxID=2593676 RepID=UPI003D8FEE89